MSLYDPLGFLKTKHAYNMPSAGILEGNGVIFRNPKAISLTGNGYKERMLLAGAVLFFIIALSAFLLSLPPRNAAAQNRTTVPAMAPVVEAASGGKPSLELHIANNGLVLLRSAKIVSINGTSLTLSTAWGSSVFLWTVRTNADSYGTHNYGTKFIDLNGNPIAVENMQAGGLVTVTGMLDQNAQEPTLDADMVRILK